MRKARLWALFGLGGMAMLPPVITLVDFHHVSAAWLFALWTLIIVGIALSARRA